MVDVINLALLNFAEFPGFFSFELLIKLIKLLMIKKYTCA